MTAEEENLPDGITLRASRRPDGHWCVTSPEYRGLLIVAKELKTALEDVTQALSMLIRLDGQASSRGGER